MDTMGASRCGPLGTAVREEGKAVPGCPCQPHVSGQGWARTVRPPALHTVFLPWQRLPPQTSSSQLGTRPRDRHMSTRVTAYSLPGLSGLRWKALEMEPQYPGPRRLWSEWRGPWGPPAGCWQQAAVFEVTAEALQNSGRPQVREGGAPALVGQSTSRSLGGARHLHSHVTFFLSAPCDTGSSTPARKRCWRRCRSWKPSPE